MNRGIITRDQNDEWVIVDSKSEDSLPIHPYYSKYDKWKDGTELDYQYSMECSTHFPTTCSCRNLKMYATPVHHPKESFMERVMKFFE